MSWRWVSILSLTILPFQIFWNSTAFAKGTVSLERVQFAKQGLFEFVDLRLDQDQSTRLFGGFDFIIQYDNTGLQFISATQGDLIGNCGWEYFTAAHEADKIHIVVLASDPQVSGEPSCFLEGVSGNLAVLKFLVTFNALECEEMPLRFYWADCGDNVLTNIAGDSLLTADTVFWGTTSNDFYSVPATLGTHEGLPQSCIAASPESLFRTINFVEGMIATSCPDSVSYRGDLNLNGMPWEFADFGVYANYFFFGLSALFPDPLMRNAQIAASDCNSDGTTLQFGDMSYLKRVIVGNTLPKRGADSRAVAQFINNTTLRSISLTTSDPLCVVFLTFSGHIVPQAATSSESVIYSQTPWGNTQVMIWEVTDPTLGYKSGPFLTYSGVGELIFAGATDWTDSNAITSIQVAVGSPCGDADGSASLNISDCVYLILYIFGGGNAPLDVRNGDVNCDGITSISDAVYLLAHIFAGGAAPCANCP